MRGRPDSVRAAPRVFTPGPGPPGSQRLSALPPVNPGPDHLVVVAGRDVLGTIATPGGYAHLNSPVVARALEAASAAPPARAVGAWACWLLVFVGAGLGEAENLSLGRHLALALTGCAGVAVSLGCARPPGRAGLPLSPRLGG